jgi:hypothetical protein
MCVGLGVATLLHGGLSYRNAYSLSVFTPFIILIGTVGLDMLLWRWKNPSADADVAPSRAIELHLLKRRSMSDAVPGLAFLVSSPRRAW